MNYDWPELVDKYIVRGETPRLSNPWDVEEPETYLRRPYHELGDPAELRQELIKVLNQATQVAFGAGGNTEETLSVLSRALRLAKLIPHADFAPTLQDIFFTTRSRRQKEGNKDKYKEVSLLAVKAMYALQPTLPTSDAPLWESMWLSLLKDREYVIAAFNGLRRLNISLALRQLPLLLRRSDLTPQDLGIILRGTKRDILNAEINLKAALIKTIVQLTEEELLRYQPLLRDAFGEEIIDATIARVRKDAERELADDAVLVTPPYTQTPESLRKQLFPPLASWLKERTPVLGVSLWLVDNEKAQVHFMGQDGIPGTEPEPPCVLKFGKHVSGTVAQTRQHLLCNLDSTEDPQVHMHRVLWDLGVRAMFSVFAESDASAEPSLELVVNFFDPSLEKLQQLQDTCIHNGSVVRQAAQRALTKYSDYWAAVLTTKLAEKPALAEVAQTLVEAVSIALPCDRERVALYLYNPVKKRLFLYVVYDTQNKRLSCKGLYGGDAQSYELGEGLTGYAAKRAATLRISDLMDTTESPRGVIPDLSNLELGELREEQGLSYLAVPLRKPAPSGFTGRLVGIAEVYRPVEKGGGRLFTPMAEHILAELIKTVTPSIASAFEKELRFYEPVAFTIKEKLSQQGRIGDVNGTLQKAGDDFRAEAKELLNDWHIAGASERTFLAYRTLFNKCTAYWVKSGPRFDESEKEARLELQQAILARDDILSSSESLGVLVTPELLTRFGISREHVERLSGLKLVLVPLVYRRRLDGIIGLEFDSSEKANSVVEEMQRGEQEKATHYVRTSMMDMWLDYRRHFLSLLATFLEQLSQRAEDEGKVNRQELINFVARGNARLIPYEKSFAELIAAALKRSTSDAKCKLSEECDNLQSFASDGKLNSDITRGELMDISSVELLAMPSAVRMVLATATASLLWGGTANVTLVKDQTQSGWSRLRIDVPRNGHEDIRRLGLDLAKGMGEFQGWLCEGETNDRGITIMLPDITSETDMIGR
jgi:hypothetical protein